MERDARRYLHDLVDRLTPELQSVAGKVLEGLIGLQAEDTDQLGVPIGAGSSYTVGEAAELLQVHPKTIYRLIKQRRIGFVAVGAAYRITKEHLDEFKRGTPARIQARQRRTYL